MSESVRVEASELVGVEDRGRVRYLTLDRAEKRNALNSDLILALRGAAREAADAHDVHCVVLRGAGPCFSAGVDVFELGGLADETAMLRPFRRVCIEAANLLEEMNKPTIASIHSACLGLGAELALACDLRVMADDVQFGLPEVKLGLIPDVGGSSRLPAVVGLGNAKELIMTGRSIGAEEAHRIGLANRVAPVPELEDVTQALVDELLAAAPLAVGASKGVLDAVAKPTLGASLELEVTTQQTLVASPDFREAGAAFMEKREPRWTGAPSAPPREHEPWRD
jgi:enoyl-CoA hydratase/carnithine racemase